MLKIKDDVDLRELEKFGFEFRQVYDNLIMFEYVHHGSKINPTVRVDGVTRTVYFSADPNEKWDLGAEEITNEVIKKLKGNKMVDDETETK